VLTTTPRLLFGALLFLAAQSLVFAQNATTNHSVRLRRDPSTASPVIENLPKLARLVLVDTKTDGGFYHVRTEDEQVGWVWSRFVDLATDGQFAGVVTHTHPATPVPADAQCNPSLWDHVYHAPRLTVIEPCIAVTGTIVDATAGKKTDGVRHEPDGDTHGWLNVDPEFAGLLNAGNKSNEGGNLVFEIICKFPVSQQDAKAACAGFSDPIAIPPVGSHVRIVGSYVQDTFHARWMEIHPVTSITVIP
jgi:hypothetical protein